MTTTVETRPQEKSTPPARPWTLLPMPWAIWFWNQSRKIVILVTGLTVLLAGMVMLVVPGPGVLGILAGLAILATEFAWARWMLKFAKERAGRLMEAAKAQWGVVSSSDSPPRNAAPLEESNEPRTK